MIRPIYLLVIISGLFIGCNTFRKKNESKSDSITSKEVHAVSEIQKQVDSINNYFVKDKKPLSIPFPLYRFSDSIQIWTNGEGSGRINLMTTLPGKQTAWPTFFVSENKLIQTRYREQVQTPTDNKVTELTIYHVNGNQLPVKQKVLRLKDGEPPGMIRLQNPKDTVYSKSDIEKRVLFMYDEITKAIHTKQIEF